MEEFAGNNRPDPWRWLIDPRSNQEIEDEIREELQFHFDQMIEAEKQHGIGEEDAEQIVLGKFGSISRYVSECKQIQTWERMMLQKVQVGLFSVVIVLMLLSYLDNRSLSIQLAQIDSKLDGLDDRQSVLDSKKETLIEPSEKSLSKVDDPDWMEIFVCDEAGKPIEGADVQVEWATTDRDRYESYTRKTDAQGLLHILRDDSVILQHLQAHGAGMNWVRRTLTQSRQDYIEQHRLVLLPSVPITIQLSDANSGKPLSNAEIVNPFSRFSYQPERTDAEGRATLDWYARGETATLSGTVYLAKDQLDSTEAEWLENGRGTIHRINGKPYFSYTFSEEFEVDEAIKDDVFRLNVNLEGNGRSGGGFGGGGGAF